MYEHMHCGYLLEAPGMSTYNDDDDDDDDEFRLNDASTHESHLRQNGVLIWFCNEIVIMMSYTVCIKM